MTMKTCNYLTKLPQEATIKKVETFRYFDLITLDLLQIKDAAFSFTYDSVRFYAERYFFEKGTVQNEDLSCQFRCDHTANSIYI